MSNQPDLEQARRYALGKLAAELPPELYYHSLSHTRDDVAPSALRLADLIGVSAEDRLLLETAALFHDLGFLERYSEHESAGIALARQALPGFGYSPEQIDIVAGLIAATHMPQQPKSLLEEILCDADLDLVGREDFWEKNRRLYEEVRRLNDHDLSEEQWLAGQVRFLEEHQFHTAAARATRNAGKAANLERMRRALAELRRGAV